MGAMASPSGEKIFGFSGPAAKAVAISVLMVAVTVFLFSLPEQSPEWHQSRDLVRKLFFIPLLLSAAWFGGPGAAASTAVVTGICGVSVVLGWSTDLAIHVSQVGELGVFWLVGGLAANFFEQQRKHILNMEEANENTLVALASALDAREHGTGLHSQRVAEYTLRLAAEMGVKEPDALAVIGKGALLHDVGKIGVPDSVLLKPGLLSPDEWEVMRKHSEVGNRMLRKIGFLREPAEIVLCHHERYDGTGYPRGLKGEEIPLGARMFAVIDVFDALTTARPYHDATSHAAAVKILRSGAGDHFDPAVVAAFERVPAGEWSAIASKFEGWA
jgi:putative nucleotidyltransferase with HDIG domain